MAAWPEQSSTRWQRFREETLVVTMPNLPHEREVIKVDLQALSRDPTETLQWLVQVSHAPADQCRQLLEGTWQRIQYITPLHQDRQLGAIATALHLTLSRYGWLQVNFRALEQGWQQHHPYHGVEWCGYRSASTPLTLGDASGALISAEIRAYFVLALLRCAGLYPLTGPTEELGQMNLAASDFCPVWRLHRAGRRTWLVRMRHRASRELVQRLVKRYATRPLQRLVVSRWPINLHMPELARIGEIDYPPELLQFPRKTEPETAALDSVDPSADP